MIKSLKGTNGAFVGVGSVQVQPMPADLSDVGQGLNDSYSAGQLPVRQVSLPVPVLLHTSGGVTHVQNPSLSELASMASTDPTFVFPLGSRSSQIVPTNHVSLVAGKTYDPRQGQDRTLSNEQFSPFELATGISQERPEVIMMTNFSPLFERGRGPVSSEHSRVLTATGMNLQQTAAGQFMDAQFNMRNLQSYHAQSQVKSLRNRYPIVDKTVIERSRAFTEALMRLRDDSAFLLNAVRMLGDGKSRLDLRHDAFLLKDPSDIARFISKNFDQLRAPKQANRFVDLAELLMSLGTRRTFSFIDCMHDLGYSQAAIRNTYSSTKIWMQVLYELKQALQNHTLAFLDMDTLYQRRDDSPAGINKPPTKYFGVADTLPSLPSLSTIINLKVGETAEAITSLQSAFASIYQNAFFKNDESRMAALAHTVSREYRYSRGLSLKQVQDSLDRFYGYRTAPAGNLTLFDAVVGTFGNNISDFSDTSERSLVSLAQARHPGNVGVLTFESKQVEGDSGTLTPGGDYVFDRVMARATSRGFDVRGCEELASSADEQLNQLLTIVDGLNLMMIPSTADPRRPGTSRDASANFLGHPIDLCFELLVDLVNPITGRTLPQVAGDRLGAVYSRARSDNKLKTMLFMHTMSRISRAYTNNVAFLSADKASDNTPLTDHLVDRIVSSLQQSVPETRSAVQLVTQRGLDRGLNTSSLTPASVKHSLKSGTVLTTIIEKFMSSVVDWFRNKTSAINGERTRYGGYLDTLVMMMAFDLAIAMIARYSNQQLVGAHRGLSGFSQGQLTFVVTQSSTNHLSSVNELIQRLNGEGSFVRQLLVTLTNALLVIGNTARSTANYFKSVEATGKLTDLLSGLGGDVDMLRLLLTEQQAMLLASTVENLVEANAEPVKTRTSLKGLTVRSMSAPEVAVLDDSAVSSEVQNALFSFFDSPEYASQHANNKKILTVGVPLGMLQRLRQSVSMRDQKRATFNDRRTDLIQVTVYKIDMQNVDIVFRPLRFLFEMSRFPVRYSSARWLDVDDGSTINDVIGAVPTRNFDQGTASSRRSPVQFNVEYASTVVAGQQGVKDARVAFDDESYSFLTSGQKAQVLHNHVVSQLLEIYVRMMTGIDVSEDNYHVVDAPSLVDTAMAAQLTRHSLAGLSDSISTHQHDAPAGAPPTGGVVFSSTSVSPGAHPKKVGKVGPAMSNAAGVPGNVDAAGQFSGSPTQEKKVVTAEQQSAVGSIDSLLDGVGRKHVAAATATMRAASRLSMTATPLASIAAWKKKVLLPKQFDRVFNVIIDPRDFDIDMPRTLATPFGKQALDLLIQHGEVVPAEPAFQLKQWGAKQWGALVATSTQPAVASTEGPGPSTGGSFRFRTRDKNAGDLVADKYFVTVETFDEGDDS